MREEPSRGNVFERLMARGMLDRFKGGVIALIAALRVRGERGFFGYALFVRGMLALLGASGRFYPDSSTRDGQRGERS